MKLAVILEDVRSVHNVGSIFRTADAVGAEKIFCCGITPAPLDRFKRVRPDFAKVALGAEQSVVWESEKDTAAAIRRLKDVGWTIAAVEQAEGAVPYYDYASYVRGAASVFGRATPRPNMPKIALVFGNEVEGISAESLALTDKILEIPMAGKKESLNVAVAFGIVAFSLRYGVVKSKK